MSFDILKNPGFLSISIRKWNDSLYYCDISLPHFQKKILLEEVVIFKMLSENFSLRKEERKIKERLETYV